MSPGHPLYLLKTAGKLEVQYLTNLGRVLDPDGAPRPLAGNTVVLTRTKEEGFELASLFLVHGIANPVEIFDAETCRYDITRCLADPMNHLVVLTWKPEEVDLVRRSGKKEIMARFT